MDSSKPETAAAGAGKPERRNPHTIRFLDPEWERIEAFAGERGLTGPEFVRFAVLAAIVGGPAGGDPADRLAPLIERTFRYSYTIATKLREGSRGLVARSPVPAPEDEPRKPRPAPPYVFSREELQRLFGAIDVSCQRSVQLDADTLRALLLLLYGAGLRFGEAQRLTLDDADLAEAVLTIRDTKFFKTRLVPVCPQLGDALRTHVARRIERPLPQCGDSTLLANIDGTPLVSATVRDAFERLLDAAGIQHDGNDGRRAPCLHSLRHAAAVHRLESWYRQGADVQRLLPVLSIWLGHARLDGTQVYLSMTPELLQEASVRFDRHVNGGGHE